MQNIINMESQIIKPYKYSEIRAIYNENEIKKIIHFFKEQSKPFTYSP